MGIFSRSHRRLGQRSRFFEFIIAPLTSKSRVWIGIGLLALAVGLILSQVMASNSQVGSFVRVPFSDCQAQLGWSQVSQAAGQPQPDFDPDKAAVWMGGNEPLSCDQAVVSDDVPLFAQLQIYLALGSLPSPQTSQLEEDSDLLSRTIDAPELTDTSGVTPIDTVATVQFSIDDGETWHLVTNLSSEHLSQGVLDLALPSFSREELMDLSVQLNISAEPSLEYTYFVDSVALTYQVGLPASLKVDLEQDQAESAVVLSAQHPTQAEARLNLPGSNLIKGLAARLNSPQEPDIDISATIEGSDGRHQALQVDRSWQGTSLNGELAWQITYHTPRNIKPGAYMLVTRINTQDREVVEAIQEVLIGVIALNFDRSSYLPGQDINTMFSVLDERGATVCDAELTLELSLNGQRVMSASSSGGEITVTDTCQLYGEHIQADYVSRFTLEKPGVYDVSLATKRSDLSYHVNDTLTVVEKADYVISRSGPTRLFPVKAYVMELSVVFNQEFNGVIREVIPANFKLLSEPNTRPYEVEQIDDNKVLNWAVSAHVGDELIFTYRFDAPDISPAFYNLGPLTMSQDGSEFSEPRRWQLAGDAVGRMLLFYDGGTIPGGWTCVSCTIGDPFYQTFPRGSDTYGGTGGTATHTHTASGSVAATGTAAVSDPQAGATLSNNAHTHTASVTVGNASNLPLYRQLKIIRADTAGEPATLPTGAIGLFDATVPTGWTRYSAQDGYYVRGNGTAGTTGGSNSHTHTVNGNVNAAGGATNGVRTGGSQVATANASHTHTYSGNSSNVSNEPPYMEMIFGQLNSSSAPPDGLLAMWDDEVPSNWTRTSGTSGAHYQLFFKGSASYGSTGGAASHSHVNTVITSGNPSASQNSRSGGAGASSTHTHQVTASSYSTPNHLPPYINVVIGKRVPQSDIEQSAYRFYANVDSTDVGSPLANLNTAANSPRQGLPFRLRVSLHVSNADLNNGDKTFKLQFAQRSGTCDSAFSGESYNDVATGSGAIRFYDNATPSDGANLTANGNDPIHSGHTVEEQTYEEANNFTNATSAVQIGEDGLWDLALVDYSAPASTNYCFRVVRSNDDSLQTYSVIPEIITDDGNGHMLLMYDGGSIPSGWTCVSCNPGDEMYQRFFRGEATYGGTGGSATHSHTASGSVAATASLTLANQAGSTISTGNHSHSISPTLGSSSNLPSYRQLKIIRSDVSGVPTTLPTGGIALFDAAVPVGWTRYSAQDGTYVYSNGTAGTTGGANSHSNSISGTTSAGSGSTAAATNGTQVSAADPAHTHTVSGNTGTDNQEPPNIATIIGQLNSAGSAPTNIITLWDGPPPGTWTNLSTSGQPFYQRFVKGSVSYGVTGGATTHSHSDTVLSSSAPSATLNRRSGAVNASGTHTHQATVSSISTENNLPPYINVVFAKMASANTLPDNPANLDQIRTSDSVSLGVGDWTNGDQIRFEADATDPDNPDDLQLCVEIEAIGTAFDNANTACGTAATYSGSAITVTVTITGLTHNTGYHWQARVKDSGGLVSSWISFGANAESVADFSNDSTNPSGSVYDGSTVGVDIDLNSGSLSSLSANWNITDTGSGVSLFEYSIGTSVGGTQILGWTSNGTTDNATANSLNLRTGQVYFFNVRSTDGGINQSTTSSDGILVAPTLSFSVSPSSITFDNLNSSNSYTSSQAATLTTSTNAYGGYVVRAFVTQLPTSGGGQTVPLFNGGTYASPDEWRGGDTGYGYTSNDSTIQGINIFGGSPCAGGGNPPCYVPFAASSPGDILADHTAAVQGTPVVNENFIVTQRVTTSSSQAAGTYTTTVIYTITARY